MEDRARYVKNYPVGGCGNSDLNDIAEDVPHTQKRMVLGSAPPGALIDLCVQVITSANLMWS